MKNFNFFSDSEIKILSDANKNKNYHHLNTDFEGFKEVMNLEILNKILSMPGLWNNQNFKMVLDRKPIGFNEFVTDGEKMGFSKSCPNPKKVQDYISKGASLVLDDIIYVLKNVKDIASELQKITWGKCQANLYFSMQSHQAFGPHYDTHDVFALHCHGEKVWNIYENFEDNPINHPIFKLPLEERIEKAGKIKEQVLLKPGDLLYLPRGQYHDALASKNGAIHIAFGINYMKPIDMMQFIWNRLVINPYLRSDVKNVKSTSDIHAINKNIVKEIDKILNDKTLLTPLLNFYKEFPYEFVDYELESIVDAGVQYNISGSIKLSNQNGQLIISNGKNSVPVPKKFEELTSYSFAEKNISIKKLSKNFQDLPDSLIDEFVGAMKQMRVLS